MKSVYIVMVNYKDKPMDIIDSVYEDIDLAETRIQDIIRDNDEAISRGSTKDLVDYIKYNTSPFIHYNPGLYTDEEIEKYTKLKVELDKANNFNYCNIRVYPVHVRPKSIFDEKDYDK